MTKEKKKSSKNNKSSELLTKKEDEKWIVEHRTGEFLSIFFSPSHPRYAAAWNELYCMYLDDIKDKESGFFKEILKLNNLLAHDQSMKSVFLLFEKIVPTIDPSDISPLKLLWDSIADVKEHNDYNKLCVFVQIATLKQKELEERIRNKGINSKLLEERKKFEENEIIHPLFASILENGDGYTKGYRNIIIPNIIEHKDYLLKTIDNSINNIKKRDKRGRPNKFFYKRDNYKEHFETVRKLYARLENYQELIEEEEKTKNTKDKNIKDDTNETIEKTKKEIRINIKKIDILEKSYYHNRFYGWIKNKEKPKDRIVISYANVICQAQYIKKIFWSPLSPWPINDYFCANSIQERTKSFLDDFEMWTILT